jgi:hypothetical protein
VDLGLPAPPLVRPLTMVLDTSELGRPLT